jgi:capsular polysaccharide biosynthesis protein
VVTVGQFFAVLRRRLPILVVAVLLGVALGVGLLLTTPKSYQSTAVVDISPTFSNSGSSNSSSSVSTITESKIATSTSVALGAKQALGFAGTPTELASKVTVTSPLSSQVLNITFTSATAQGAADGANAFARAYLTYRTQSAQQELTARSERIQVQVAGLQKALAALHTPVTGTPSAQQSLLQNQIQQLQSQLNTYQTSVITPGQIAGAATVPSAASSPKSYLYLAGGLLLGLLVGIVLAVVRDRRDDRVRGSADLEQSLGAPVIAEAVSAEARSKAKVGAEALAAFTAERSAEADAYRTITTTVTSDSADSRIVLLCGTGHSGPSLAPLNLAVTFATQGLKTVIAGPATAVAPAGQLLDVQLDAASGGSARLADQLAQSAKLANLYVLSLGDEVRLGATLRANGDNLDDVLTKVDMIVLDGINIELPSTSLRLGQIADEAVVVAYRNRSTHLDVERLARHLAQVRATVLGGLLLTRKTGRAARRGTSSAAPSVSAPSASIPSASSPSAGRDRAAVQPAAGSDESGSHQRSTGQRRADDSAIDGLRVPSPARRQR